MFAENPPPVSGSSFGASREPLSFPRHGEEGGCKNRPCVTAPQWETSCSSQNWNKSLFLAAEQKIGVKICKPVIEPEKCVLCLNGLVRTVLHPSSSATTANATELILGFTLCKLRPCHPNSCVGGTQCD